MFWHVLVCFGMFWYVLIRHKACHNVPKHGNADVFWYVLLCLGNISTWLGLESTVFEKTVFGALASASSGGGLVRQAAFCIPPDFMFASGARCPHTPPGTDPGAGAAAAGPRHPPDSLHRRSRPGAAGSVQGGVRENWPRRSRPGGVSWSRRSRPGARICYRGGEADDWRRTQT